MNDHAHENEKFVLEVIACSLEDAVNAEKGGADRLELVRELEHGGYTPPLDLVRAIQDAVDLPLRVMLREQDCYGLTEIITVEKLCCIANELNRMKIDGVVLGFLRSGGVDTRLIRKILRCGPGLRATFHHAFENTSDKFAAIDALKSIGQIDRILSHGGFGSRAERVGVLREYSSAANPEIEILAGGRIDREMIGVLRERTNIREFHVGSAARREGKVSAGHVERLAAAVRGLYV